MKDQDIDVSDNPELGERFFKEAIWWPGPSKLPCDLIPMSWRSSARVATATTTINAVLRKYVEARKGRARLSR